jgi:hypothetical protein
MLGKTGAGKTPKGRPSGMAFSPGTATWRGVSMSNPSDFTVKVCNNRDLVISKLAAEFEVTYRREVYYPMLVASDVLLNDFDESKITLLAQAWRLALDKAKSLGWLEEQKRRGRRRLT